MIFFKYTPIKITEKYTKFYNNYDRILVINSYNFIIKHLKCYILSQESM